MMDPYLKGTLNQTIYVAEPTGRTTFGDPTFGTPAKRKARVESDRRLIINASTGLQEITTHAIVVEDVIDQRARIWLPGLDHTDARQSRQPKQVQHAVNENGSTHHYEVLI